MPKRTVSWRRFFGVLTTYVLAEKKTDAARIAFKMILGMGDDEQLSDVESERISLSYIIGSVKQKKKLA